MKHQFETPILRIADKNIFLNRSDLLQKIVLKNIPQPRRAWSADGSRLPSREGENFVAGTKLFCFWKTIFWKIRASVWVLEKSFRWLSWYKHYPIQGL